MLERLTTVRALKPKHLRIICLSIITAVLFTLNITLVNFFVPSICVPVLKDYAEITTDLIVGLVASVLIIPILEEYIFRRLLFKALYLKFGSAVFVFSSAFVFAAAHFQHYVPILEAVSLINTFIFGIVLGVIYVDRRSLIDVSIVHVFGNLLVATLTPVGSTWCSNEVGTIKLLIIVVCFVLLSLFLYWIGNDS